MKSIKVKTIAPILFVIGLWMLPLSLTLQSTVASAVDCSAISGASSQTSSGLCLPADPTGASQNLGGDQTVGGLIIYIIDIMLGLAAILSVLFIIIGGYQYIFDGGSSESAKKGKKTVVNALIGLIIIVLSYTIISVLSNTISSGTQGY